MVVELKKKVVTKEDKSYTNFYLKVGSRLVPISVNLIKDSEGNIKNSHDYSLLCTIAERLENNEK